MTKASAAQTPVTTLATLFPSAGRRPPAHPQRECPSTEDATPDRLLREKCQLGLALAAQHGELLLQVALDAVLLEAGRLAHLVRDVAQHLDQADLEPVFGLPGALPDDDRVTVLLERGRRRHPVEGLVAPRIGVDEHRAVVLE